MPTKERCTTNPRERSVLQSTKLEGVGDLKSALTSDMEMLGVEFSLLVFSLALAQYFPLCSLFSHSEWDASPVPLYVGGM